MPRIILIHPYRPSMGPIEAAFAELWPEAEVCALLDESLYADVATDGTMQASVPDRIATLVRHALASKADAIVFTGSTFGPAMDNARAGLSIPVLKADEAMAIHAAEKGGKVLLVCTAGRALPVLVNNLEAAMRERDTAIDISTLVVAEAKAALVRGATNEHDALLVSAIVRQDRPDTLLLGQMSMGRVPALLPPAWREITMTSAEATVQHLQGLLA